jgi:hypothetical protein
MANLETPSLREISANSTPCSWTSLQAKSDRTLHIAPRRFAFCNSPNNTPSFLHAASTICCNPLPSLAILPHFVNPVPHCFIRPRVRRAIADDHPPKLRIIPPPLFGKMAILIMAWVGGILGWGG